VSSINVNIAPAVDAQVYTQTAMPRAMGAVPRP
jgi:hypothetical protein